jgi:hypothetical protein
LHSQSEKEVNTQTKIRKTSQQSTIITGEKSGERSSFMFVRLVRFAFLPLDKVLITGGSVSSLSDLPLDLRCNRLGSLPKAYLISGIMKQLCSAHAPDAPLLFPQGTLN